MSDNHSFIPSERLRVFISSAQKEENGYNWLEIRRKIKSRLENDPYINPFIIEDSASYLPSSDYYKRQVAHTDVYVLLVKGDVRNGTKDEYQLAKKYNKPMLVYFLEDENPNFNVNNLRSDIEGGDICTYRPLRSYEHIEEIIYNDIRSNQIITFQDQPSLTISPKKSKKTDKDNSLTTSPKKPKETDKDNFYFKISFSSEGGSLFIYSKNTFGINKSPKVQITEEIWNDFVECCKDFITVAFPGVQRDYISITLLSPLGIYSCAPNDGHSYYDKKYRINFKVQFLQDNVSPKYDTVHFDINDNFDISLSLLGNYSSKSAPQNAPLEYYGINEAELLPIAKRLICFAMRNDKIITSPAFKAKFYSDLSGGYILDFIQR